MLNKFNKPGAQTFGTKIRNMAKNVPKNAGGFLSKLFLDVLAKRCSVSFDRIDQEKPLFERWNALIISYLTDPKNAIPQHKEAIAAARGNLTKELIKGEMSWKVFIKALRVLQIVKIDFHLTFTLHNGRTLKHDTTLNLGDVYVSDEFDFDKAISPKEKDLSSSSVPNDILG